MVILIKGKPFGDVLWIENKHEHNSGFIRNYIWSHLCAIFKTVDFSFCHERWWFQANMILGSKIPPFLNFGRKSECITTFLFVRSGVICYWPCSIYIQYGTIWALPLQFCVRSWGVLIDMYLATMTRYVLLPIMKKFIPFLVTTQRFYNSRVRYW